MTDEHREEKHIPGTRARAPASTHTHTHTYSHARTHTRAHTHTHTHIHTHSLMRRRCANTFANQRQRQLTYCRRQKQELYSFQTKSKNLCIFKLRAVTCTTTLCISNRLLYNFNSWKCLATNSKSGTSLHCMELSLTSSLCSLVLSYQWNTR